MDKIPACLQDLYFRKFEEDYSAHCSDQKSGLYRAGMEAVLRTVFGQSKFDEFYADFTKRRKAALESGQLLPFSGISILRRESKQNRKQSKGAE